MKFKQTLIAAVITSISASALASPAFKGYSSTGSELIPKSKSLNENPNSVVEKIPADLNNETANLPVPQIQRPTPKKEANKKIISASEMNSKRITLNAENGVLQVIYIAKGHLNRIVTPFDSPVVTTASKDVSVKKVDNVLFFGTNSDKATTVYISPESNPEISIPIVFKALNTPPKDIKMNVKGYVKSKAVSKEEITQDRQRISELVAFEKKGITDYEGMLTSMAITLAKGEIPKGYSQTKVSLIDNLCLQEGIHYQAEQKYSGISQDIVVLSAKNTSLGTVQINEKKCFINGVRLVSSYPTTLLKPGSVSEVYVVTGKEIHEKPNTRKRVFED